VRNYVVAAWERRRHRERELHQVTAETAEHAIVAIASAKPLDEQPGVYEAWPAEAPELNLRITYEAPRRRHFRLRPETE
jgi:predicted RNA-binding protein associated with RNAse of E/G family